MLDPQPLFQPKPFRMLLDDAVKVARRNFRRIYLPSALPIACLTVVITYFQVRWMTGMLRGIRNQAFDPALFQGCAMLGLAALVLGIANGLCYTAMGVAAVDAALGRPPSVARGWRFALQPRVLGTLFLVALATAGATVLCFFPGIYVALLLSFVVPVMVAEERFGTEALARSSQLVRHNPQRDFVKAPIVKVLVVYVVSFILSYAIGLVVQLPFVVVQQIALFRQISSGAAGDPAAAVVRMQWIQVPAAIPTSLASTAVYLYVFVALALLYRDVKLGKEGTDLEQAIDGLASRPPGIER